MKRLMTDLNEVYNFCEETGNTRTYKAFGRARLLQENGGWESTY
jgi:hypothetical protein